MREVRSECRTGFWIGVNRCQTLKAGALHAEGEAAATAEKIEEGERRFWVHARVEFICVELGADGESKVGRAKKPGMIESGADSGPEDTPACKVKLCSVSAFPSATWKRGFLAFVVTLNHLCVEYTKGGRTFTVLWFGIERFLGVADLRLGAAHFHDAPEAGVQSLAPRGGDDGRAVFGAEDDMAVDREVCGWHGVGGSCAPAGARGLSTRYPVADATG